jgi:hypothetical protein
MKHTPGPWRVSAHREIMAGKDCIVQSPWSGPFGIEVADANARLIAAAPELLASLQEIFGMLERGELVREISNDGHPDWALFMLDFVPKLTRAQMAIFKATGSKP